MKKMLSIILSVILMCSMVVNVRGAQVEDLQFITKSDGTIKILKYTGSEIKVDIPEKIDGKTVTEIGEDAFRNDKTLEEVTFPDTLKVIEEYAFESCSNLKKVTFPDSLKEIGMGAFSRCDSITEIALGKNVTKMGNSVFRNCKNLKKATLNDKIDAVEGQTFSGCENLVDIKIPPNVTKINNYAFFNCRALTELPIGENVAEIGAEAYGLCTHIRTVELPMTLKTINRYAFERCVRLRKVTIPNRVTKMYEYAFGDCRNLKTVYFYAKNCDLIYKGWSDEIERKADNLVFSGCSDLEKIVIADTVETIPVDIFRYSARYSLREIKICNDAKKISYKSIDNSKFFKAQKGTYNNVVKADSKGNISIIGYGTANVKFIQNNNKVILKFNVIPRRVKTKNIVVTKSGNNAVIRLKDTRNLKFTAKVSTDENFEKSTNLTCKNKTFKIKNMKKNKTYYFRVRAYKKVNGKKIVGNHKTIVIQQAA